MFHIGYQAPVIVQKCLFKEADWNPKTSLGSKVIEVVITSLALGLIAAGVVVLCVPGLNAALGSCGIAFLAGGGAIFLGEFAIGCIKGYQLTKDVQLDVEDVEDALKEIKNIYNLVEEAYESYNCLQEDDLLKECDDLLKECDDLLKECDDLLKECDGLLKDADDILKEVYDILEKNPDDVLKKEADALSELLQSLKRPT